jgi:hypothetical protein
VTRAYRWLTVAVVLGAAALALLARAPKPAPRPKATEVAAPAESVAIEIQNGTVRPERTQVRKGTPVVLTVRNQDDVPRGISLSGYADRWAAEPIGARATVVLRFRADLPGQDFAWLVDGKPAGVFVVAGSHLEEGHR